MLRLDSPAVILRDGGFGLGQPPWMWITDCIEGRLYSRRKDWISDIQLLGKTGQVQRGNHEQNLLLKRSTLCYFPSGTAELTLLLLGPRVVVAVASINKVSIPG